MLALICMILHLNGIGWQTNNQIAATVNAIYIQNQFDAGIAAAQTSTESKEGSDEDKNKKKGSVAVKLTKVPTTVSAQQRVDQLNFLSQTGKPTPQNVELIQTSAEADTNIGADHVIMPLQNNNNYGYMGEFFLGSKNTTAGDGDDECAGDLQKIRILLDTGSANSWILSRQALPTNWDPETSDQLAFDPNKSCGGTFHEPEDDKKQNVKITFGSGYLKGYFVEDQCTIGDKDSEDESDRLLLPSYTFGMVTEETCFHNTFDAIVGMAYPEFAEPGVTPFFDSMMDADILKQNVFAFHMSMNPDDEDSEVMFGDWNTDKIDEDWSDNEGGIDWHSVQHKLFWSINLDDVLINGTSIGLCNGTRQCLFTPDTGTSLITFPGWASRQFKEDYPEYSTKTACESEFGYGNLTYVINNIEYPIPSHHWMSREIDTGVDEGGKCDHTIGTLDVGQNGLDNLFIGGDVFMQIYYTVFDRNLDMVGFAKAHHTAPEIVHHYDTSGSYVETLEVCEEAFIDASLCDD